MSNYLKYRGKCKEMCEALVLERPDLTLVRGHYYEPSWDSEEPHWWCKDELGTIVDPTSLQFPTGGIDEFYTEFSGMVDCENCGKTVKEEDGKVMGNYMCCSDSCCMRLVGL